MKMKPKGPRAGATEIIIPIDGLLGTYNLDFNGDGTPEYTFTRFDFEPPTLGPAGDGISFVPFVNELNAYGNGVVGYTVSAGPKPGTYASALGAGELIDGSRSYVSDSNIILSGKAIDSYGEFYGVPVAFAGLRFELPDGTLRLGRDPRRAGASARPSRAERAAAPRTRAPYERGALRRAARCSRCRGRCPRNGSEGAPRRSAGATTLTSICGMPSIRRWSSAPRTSPSTTSTTDCPAS